LLARKSLPNDGAVAAGAIAGFPAGEGSAVFTSADIKCASGREAANAFGETTEVVAEAVFAVELEVAGVESEAGVRCPSAASAHWPKNTASMAATATLTSLPLT